MAGAPVARIRTRAARMAAGHGSGGGGAGAGQGVERAPADRQGVLGGDGGDAEGQARVAGGIGARLEDDLAPSACPPGLLERDAGLDGDAARRCRRRSRVERAAGRPPSPARTRRRPGRPPAPGFVGDPGDGPAGFGDRRHEGVGVVVAQRRRHLVLLLEEQALRGAPRGPVQLHAGRRERGPRSR